MSEPLRIHGPAVLQELPQTFQPSLSEEGRRLTTIGFGLTLGQFARRLRCSSCGQMPDDVTVMSTDDPHVPTATLRIVIEQESGRTRTGRLGRTKLHGVCSKPGSDQSAPCNSGTRQSMPRNRVTSVLTH